MYKKIEIYTPTHTVLISQHSEHSLHKLSSKPDTKMRTKHPDNLFSSASADCFILLSH